MKFSKSSACSLNVARWRVRAFTLVELLVVVGLIALLAGGIGLALGDSGGNSLAGAQTTLASLVATTRAQAAVNQTEARLLVYGSRPPGGDQEKFLRLLQVVRAEPAGSNTWIPVGTAVTLPRGVYVVPNPPTGLLAAGVIWPTNPSPVSTLNAPTFNPVLNTVAFGPSYWLEFKADGTLNTALGAQASPRLALTVGIVANNLPQFTNSGNVRGLLLRPSGAVSFVNDAASF